MIMKRIFALVIVVLTITSLLTFSEISEGTDNLDGRTRNTAIEKDVVLDVNETKFLHFTSNVKFYEFMNEGDGYSYTILQNIEIGGVEHTLIDPINRTFNDTWPSDGIKVVNAEHVKISLMKDNTTNGITLAVTLTDSKSTDFYLKFSVSSYGLLQEFYYKIHVTYRPAVVYTYVFTNATMDYEGNFSSQGAMYQGETLVDRKNYQFFAIGLYPGISVHNDLTITGIADDTDTRWLTTNSISFTIVATDKVTHEVFVSSAKVNFTYDHTFETPIEFSLKEGGKELINERSSNKSVSVLENADLTLSLNHGTSAEVVYSDENGVEKKYLWTPSTGTLNSPIATNGAGKYDVTLKQLDGSTDMFSVNVIATLVPVNKIYVTCSSV